MVTGPPRCGWAAACCRASAVRSSVQVRAVARASVASGTLVVASAVRMASASWSCWSGAVAGVADEGFEAGDEVTGV
jgi:hypothetical protein